ncbi:MAG: PAS domain S-box protein [Planctomycetota bacterium]|jgi:PAS domain S-box-containing protein
MAEPVRLLVVSGSGEYTARILRECDTKNLPATAERVGSPDEMRAALGRGPWDAAVSDAGIPGFDVEDVVRLAKEAVPEVPVIVVTESAREEESDRALRAGAAEFISMAELECAVCAVERVVREAEARRDRAEATRRLSEKDGLLHTVVSNAPVILLAADKDGTVTLFEGKGVAVFGPEFRDIVGLNVFRDLVGKCPVLGENCRRALAGEEVSRLVKVSTGVFLDTQCRPLRDEEGEVSGVICVATDVTERERARQALADSEVKYRALVENTNDMPVAFDADGRVTYVGPQVERLGYAPDEVVSRSIFDFIHEDDLESVEADLRRTMETGEEFPTEFRMADRDGRLVWYEEVGKVQRDEAGRITGIMGVLRDVTQRKLAEEACRASEEKYRRLFENESDAVMLFDAETKRFEDANPATLELFGYEREEFLSLKVEDISAEKEETRKSIEGVLRSESGVASIPERRFVRRDGSVFPGEIVSGVFVSAGRRKIIGAVRDMTDRKGAEEELRKAHDELERRVEERTAELHVMNDDLRREIEERKATEERLRLAEYSIEHSREPTFWIGRDARIIRVNDAGCRHFGYSRDELLTMTVHDIDPLFPAEAWPDHWADLRKHGSLTFESVHRGKDGREFPVDIRVNHVVFEGEEYNFAFARDISERKETERCLRLAQTSIELSSEPTWWIDKDARLVRVNRAACQALGYTREELLRLTIPDIDPEYSLAKVQEVWESLKGGRSQKIETVQRTKDGRELPVEVSVSLIEFEGEEMGLAFIRDITERKEAERAIRESEERYRTFVQGFQGIAYRAELDWLPLFFHGKVEEITGYTEAEFVAGSPRWDEVVHPDDLKVLIERDAGLRTVPGFSADREYRISRRDGEVRWVRDIIRNVCDESGTPILLDGTLTDVTERRRTEDALRLSEEKFRQFFENEPEYCYMVSPEGLVLDVNQAALDALGYARDELVGKPVETIYPPESLPRIRKLFEKWRETGSIRDEEVVVATKTGERRTVLLSVANVRNGEGRIRHSVSVQRDITERKAAEEEIASLARFPSENPNPVMRLDGEGTIIYANSASNELLREWQTGIGDRVPDHWRETAAKVLLAGSPQTGELACCGRVYLAVIAPVTKAGYANLYASDITEHKAAEDALRQERDFVARIMEGLSDAGVGLDVVDANCAVLYQNRMLADRFGSPGNTPCYEFYMSRDEPCEGCPMKRAIASGKPEIAELKGSDGRLYEVLSTPLPAPAGEAARTLEILRDITERRRAEEELRKSQGFVRTALDAQLDTFFLFEPATGRAVQWNRAFRDVSGYTDEEIAGLPALDSYYGPEDLARAMDFMQKVLEEGTGTIELGLICRDGRTVPTEYRVSVIRDEQGKPQHIISIGRDVTERKRAELALQESEERFKTFADATFEGVGITSKGRIIDVTERLAAILGYERDELVGADMTNFIVPEHRDMVLERAMSDYREPYEFKGIRKDGSVIDVEVRGRTIQYRGHPRRITALRDITDYKRAVEALHDERSRLESIIRAAPVGIGVSVDSVITEVNEYLCAMVGYSMEELLGKSARMVYATEEEFERVGEAIREGLEEEGTALVETRFRRKDGAGVDVLLSVAPIDAADPSRGLMNVFLDMTDRKRAEDALRESEGRLRSLIQSAPTVVLFLSPEGRVLELNAEAERLYGRSRDEALGMDYLDAFLPEESREGVSRDMREVLEGKLTLGFENEVIAADGTRRLLSWNAGRVLDARGHPAGVVAVGLDTTDRKRAEDALRESEEKFRSIVESSPMGIHLYELEPDGRLVFTGANPAADRILGVENSQFVGRTIEEAFPPLVESEVPERYRRAAAAGEGWQTSQFAYEYGEISGAYDVFAFQTSPGRMAAFFLDVTERERAAKAVRDAQQALRDSERRFRGVVEASPMGIFETDRDGRVLYTNPKWCSITGMSMEESLGFGWTGALHPDDRERMLAEWNECLREKRGYSGRFRFIRPSGETRLVHTRTTPILDEAGEVVRHVGANEDITERERAEEAVRAREALLARTQAIGHIGSWELDLVANSLKWSDEAYRIFGLQLHEFGATYGGFLQCVHPDDRAAVDSAYTTSVREREDGYEIEHRIVRRDSGELRIVHERCEHVKDASGRVVRSVGMVQDITDSKRSQEALRESEERFRTLTESTSDFVWETDAEGAYTYASPKVKDLLGYEPSEVVGRTPFDLMPPDEAERVRSLLAEIRGRAEPFSGLENTNVRRDGRKIVIETGGVPFFDDEGRLRGYRGIDRDITERKRAENELREAHDELELRVEERTTELAEANEQLRRSEETYRSLVTHLPDAVTVTGPDGAIRYVSGHRADLHGVGSVDEMLGLRTADLVVPEDRERFGASLRQAFETGAAEAAEFSVLRSDGSTFIAEESFGVLRGADGRPNSVVTVVRDVTGRKELERRLVESQRLEAVGRLAGGLAHDFNNLLTAIGGFANRILKKLRPESPLRTDATQIRKASDMAASLTSQLLAFSRRQIMQPVVLTLNEVLEDVEMMLQRLIGEDVELAIKRAPAPGLTLADPGQIGQVIVNLAVNARDAMPFGGVLTIETSDVEFGPEEAPDHPGVPPGEYVTVSVTDTGAGIPPDVLPHIFEPFYTTKEQGKGTGLGLSTVYGIVTQSGGHVRVWSEVGRGSRFVIYLPRIAAGHEEEPGAEPDAFERSLQGDETVLLVEDEKVVKDLTRLTLTDYGYRVLEASDGNEAIAVAARHEGPIHLLLTDVVMPQMSGREVATRIVASRPGTKVIFMSGYTDSIEVRGVGEGDIPLIAKPFGEEDLARLVREVLDSARERPAAN